MRNVTISEGLAPIRGSGLRCKDLWRQGSLTSEMAGDQVNEAKTIYTGDFCWSLWPALSHKVLVGVVKRFAITPVS